MFPRWLSLLFMLVLGYMIYAAGQAAHTPAIPAPLAIPAITEENYPALAHTIDIERWKRALNPDYAAKMNCSVDAAKKRGALAMKTVRDVEGSGAGAVCGESILLMLTIWYDDGGKAFDKKLTLSLGARDLASGLDAGLVGIKTGETRTLILPPHALTRRKDSNAPAAAIAALPASRLAVVTAQRLK